MATILDSIGNWLNFRYTEEEDRIVMIEGWGVRESMESRNA